MTTKTLASSLALLAASSMLVAQGEVINSIGFEDFVDGTSEVLKPTTGFDDNGQDTTLDNAYFLVGADDASFVTNHPSGVTVTSIPEAFNNSVGAQYLSLSTEGGTLFRSVNHLKTENDEVVLGDAYSIPSSGLFVDTLVQFTPCEDTPSLNDNENKLAIWLSTSNTVGDAYVTNLCVRAGYWTKDGGGNVVKTGAKTYKLAVSGVTFDAGSWYRLTVEAMASATSENYPAFKIYIDGTFASSTDEVSDDADLADEFKRGGVTVIFPSMQGSVDLKAVGFQGTGAVDDFVVTTDAPGFLTLDFTLTWDANVTSIKAVINYDDWDGESELEEFVSFNVSGAGTTNLPVSAEQKITFLYSLIGHTAEMTEDWSTTGSAAGSVGVEEVPDTIWEGGEEVDVVIGYSYTIYGAGAVINLNYTSGGSTPIEPGQEDPTVYTSAADAAVAAQNVEIGVPAAVAAIPGFDATAEAAYKGLFGGKVRNNGDGTYSVFVDLTEDAVENVLKPQADADAGLLAATLSDATADSATINATLGLYYAIEYGTALDGIDYNTEGTLATGSTISLDVPAKGGTAGFYKVIISATPITAVAP